MVILVGWVRAERLRMFCDGTDGDSRNVRTMRVTTADSRVSFENLPVQICHWYVEQGATRLK